MDQSGEYRAGDVEDQTKTSQQKSKSPNENQSPNKAGADAVVVKEELAGYNSVSADITISGYVGSEEASDGRRTSKSIEYYGVQEESRSGVVKNETSPAAGEGKCKSEKNQQMRTFKDERAGKAQKKAEREKKARLQKLQDDILLHRMDRVNKVKKSTSSSSTKTTKTSLVDSSAKKQLPSASQSFEAILTMHTETTFKLLVATALRGQKTVSVDLMTTVRSKTFQRMTVANAQLYHRQGFGVNDFIAKIQEAEAAAVKRYVENSERAQKEKIAYI